MVDLDELWHVVQVMGQSVTLRVIVAVAVVVVGGLLSTYDVTALPVPTCFALINHVQSLVTSARPLPPAQLPLYLACLGVERHHDQEEHDVTADVTDNDVIVRQLLSLDHPDAVDRGRWSALDRAEWSPVSDPPPVCGTVECLAVRAALTFEPCASLTQAQCSTLIKVLENLISVGSDNDEATPARLFGDHFRQQLAARDRKPRQSHVTPDDATRTKRLAASTGKEKVESRNDEETIGSASSKRSGNGGGMERITFGAGVARRTRRSASPRGGIPFHLPDPITPETQAIVASYLEWRRNNGYGRLSGRWG